MNTKWNNLLLQIEGQLYFADSNLASYDLKFVDAPNINMVGYSESLQFLLIRFSTGKRFIYKEVPKEIFEGLIQAKSIGSFMVSSVKGFFRYEEVTYWIEKASPTDICKHYRNMQYNLNISLGCYLTDRPDLIEKYSASENILWQFEYQEQPENCQRIK